MPTAAPDRPWLAEYPAEVPHSLAPFKVPRTIDLRAALPRSTVGKVLRRVLRDEAV